MYIFYPLGFVCIFFSILLVCILCIQGTVLLIGQVGRVFVNDRENRGPVPGRIIPKTLNMVLDTLSITRYV